MKFGWIQSLLIGIVTGLTEILPVSAPAHNRILVKFMGRGDVPALMRFFVDLGVFFALVLACQPHILKILRAKKMARIPKKKRKRPLDIRSLMDFRLLTTMVIPVVPALVFYRQLQGLSSNMIIMATMLFLNGLILYIPQFLPSSNKDCRTLSRVEGLLMGLGGALFAIPGLSGMGNALSVASVTGVERKYGLTMILMMHIVVVGGKLVYDLLDLVSGAIGVLSVPVFLSYILASAAAFVMAWLAIRILRGLAEDKGYGFFAYYSWGFALFTFILTLMA